MTNRFLCAFLVAAVVHHSVKAVTLQSSVKDPNLHFRKLKAPKAQKATFIRPLDPCSCEEWAKVYALTGSSEFCSGGLEMDGFGNRSVATWADKPDLGWSDTRGAGVCQLVFPRMLEGICVNRFFGAEATIDEDGNYVEPESWCYVSDKCENYQVAASRGAASMSGISKIKTCQENRDKRLQDLPPRALASYAKAHGMYLGDVLRYAYPAIPKYRLADLLTYFHIKPSELPDDMFEKMHRWQMNQAKGLSYTSRKMLKKLLASNKTMLVDSNFGIPPFAVVNGEKLYWVNFENATKSKAFRQSLDYDWPVQAFYGYRTDDMTQRKKYGKVDLRCVRGCKTMHPFF